MTPDTFVALLLIGGSVCAFACAFIRVAAADRHVPAMSPETEAHLVWLEEGRSVEVAPLVLPGSTFHLTEQGQASWEAHVADAVAHTERASVTLPGRRLAVVPEQRQPGASS